MTAVLPPTNRQPASAERSRPTLAGRRGLIVLGVLLAVALVAATIVAIHANRGPQSPGTPPTTTTQSTTPTTTPTTTPSSSLTPQEIAQIAQTAREVVTEIVGMVGPIASPVRLRDDGMAAVDFRPLGPNGVPVEGATTVLFTRYGATWQWVGTVCDAIRVDAPTPGQAITTPLAVSGQADVFEGTVIVRILDPAGGKLVERGRGIVTGGGFHTPAPFQGQITFQQPGGGPGWVVFFEESAANGQVVRATTVIVSFPHS